MARTLLATLPAAALALRATRTTVSMHTNIFPTFTIKDKAAAPGQRPIQAAAAGFFLLGASVDIRMVLLRLREARCGGGARESAVRRRARPARRPEARRCAARRAGRRAAAAAAARPGALRRTASVLRERMGPDRRHTARALLRAPSTRETRDAQTTTPYQHRPSPSSTSASRTRRPKVDASTTAGP